MHPGMAERLLIQSVTAVPLPANCLSYSTPIVA
jgi:hypothetical protein